jgi:hypothetical protein
VNLDRLLLWLSARGRGSWSTFRAKVEELCDEQTDTLPGQSDDNGEESTGANSDLPIYQEARFALQRLGHAEFYTPGAENGWRVVPPTVAFPTDASTVGFLCGARSPALLKSLQGFGGLDVLVSQLENMPQRIQLQGAPQDVVAACATKLGLKIQKAAPLMLLSVLPSVRDAIAWHRSAMPETPGWSVHRFSISSRRWVEVSSTDAAKSNRGLFRFVLKHQRFYYLRWRNCSYRVPVQVGKYAVMQRRRRVLQYHAGRRALSTLPTFRPPLLIERALVLCSGQLGQVNPASGLIEYTDVPPSVAHLAAQLLHQEIK